MNNSAFRMTFDPSPPVSAARRHDPRRAKNSFPQKAA
jgi:hypothetical protein